MVPEVVKDRQDPEVIWHYLLTIHQPSRYCIELLQRYTTHDPKLSIYRLSLAFDVTEICKGATREEVVDAFENLFHLRYRRTSDEIHDHNGTIYSIRVVGRKSRPYRTTAIYTGRASKITGECEAIHFEIRLERKRSVFKVIEKPEDLLTIKPDEFFAKQIAIKDHRDVLERITQRLIRGTNKQHPTPHPLIHVERRVRAFLHRYRPGMEHVSTFARYYKKQFERLQLWDCIDIERTLNWASRDVVCDDKVGELHCLLSPNETDRPRLRKIQTEGDRDYGQG
jgi:hypothetical protein